MKNQSPTRHWLYLVSLIFAGESIYLLPYLRKSFQTSMEQVYAVDAIEIGLINGMFGILALVCYFPGGWLADRFSARVLLTVSLLATGLAGFAMLAPLGFNELLALHAFWGVSSVLTFWAALIKATRGWGGSQQQGLSFGLLDGGRGIVAAVMVSSGTVVFALAPDVAAGLRSVVTLYASSAIAAGCAVWNFVRSDAIDEAPGSQETSRTLSSAWRRTRVVVGQRDIWRLATIIFCAYFLFLGTYEFPAYAERGFGQSKLFGAQLASFRDWLRPVAAIAAGLLADRLLPTTTLAAAFALLVASYAALAMFPAGLAGLTALWLMVGTAALAVFALRGVYFAVLQQARIPVALTGTSVGLVSVFGYLPDIFAPALAGWFVVTYPEGDGYRLYFLLLTIVAVVGFIAARSIKGPR